MKKKAWEIPGKQDVLLICLLTIFSIFHKVNKYGVVLFSYDLIIYVVLWILIILFLSFIINLLSRSERYFFTVIYMALFFLNFGEIQDFFLFTLKNKFFASSWILVGCFCFLMIVIRQLYKRKHIDLNKQYNFFLLLFFLLNIVEIVNLIVWKVDKKYDIYKVDKNDLTLKQITTAEKPDIYYIIFDSYTNNSCLRKYWRFSNDSIVSFLQRHNFKVTNNSHSSYDFTAFSINSTLNLNYLHIPGTAQHDFINFNYGRRALDSALVLRWLQKQGYKTSYYSILSPSFDLNQTYPFGPDEPLYWLRRQTIERVWLVPSMKKKLLSMLNIKHISKEELALNEIDRYGRSVEDSLKKSDIQDSGPRFIYAHFVVPHTPYMYRKDGSRRSLIEMSGLKSRQKSAFYLEQVIYANLLMKRIVTQLLGSGKKDKIIIIQGDHGFRDYPVNEPGDRLGIFNAIYFQDSDYSLVSDSVLAGNTFRIVFNKYFKQELPLLK